MNTPVVLSYFSQSHDPHDPYLEFLEDEYRCIADCWEKFQQTGSERNINVVFPARGSADAGRIDDDIRAFKHRVIIFHFSGHAGAEQLIFSDKSARAKGLAGLLGEAPNLKIVFLNGCATHDQVNLLFSQNVKAVIATKGRVNDGLAKEFSSNFYAAVSTTDYTIKEAFKHAINTLIKDGLIPEDTSTNLSPWRGLVTDSAEEKDRWDLYVKEGFSAELENKNWWKIGVINPSKKEVLTGGNFWDRIHVVLFSALFLLGIAIIAFGIFFKDDFKIAVMGLASICISAFGMINQRRYVTAEFNEELVDESIIKKLRLF
ncbi:hypothetical protein [Dyadobacter psychrotolerans]|uniref:CHAT domain-containing protein n=1 Tax=Dyadobacter psychrotolerans TaxID=2541721 RepID=A0A4R5DMS8_9BACT|nr:hypothetical protein [Dyadobacter psychrotolerans]TDE14827.1 hypothetical protein E0F88_16735 [Dyadobacter psychrotolerans]